MKFKGLKNVCGQTKDLKGDYSDVFLQLHYNIEDDYVFTTEHVGSGSYSIFQDENILNCGFLFRPKTMEEIKAQVVQAVDMHERYQENMQKIKEQYQENMQKIKEQFEAGRW